MLSQAKTTRATKLSPELQSCHQSYKGPTLSRHALPFSSGTHVPGRHRHSESRVMHVRVSVSPSCESKWEEKPPGGQPIIPNALHLSAAPGQWMNLSPGRETQRGTQPVRHGSGAVDTKASEDVTLSSVSVYGGDVHQGSTDTEPEPEQDQQTKGVKLDRDTQSERDSQRKRGRETCRLID